MTIVKRLVKGSELTYAEMDGNFTDLEAQVAAKSATNHTHVSTFITDFNAAVDARITGKADTSHAHATSDITGFNAAVDARLTGKSDLGHTHTATAISDSTSAGRAVLTAADAAAQRAALVAATTAQVGQFSFYVPTVANGDLLVMPMEAFVGSVTKITTDCESGSCTLTGKVNSTALGGTANSVSTTKTSQTHSSANVWAAGDDLVFAASSNSSCLGLRATVTFARTLA